MKKINRTNFIPLLVTLMLLASAPGTAMGFLSLDIP